MKISTRLEPVNYVTLDDGVTYRLNYVAQVIEELESCDGIFSTLTIMSEKFGQFLERREVAVRNTRGGYYRGRLHAEFKKEFEQLVEEAGLSV